LRAVKKCGICEDAEWIRLARERKSVAGCPGHIDNLSIILIEISGLKFNEIHA
jgi:urocanate hydratase